MSSRSPLWPSLALGLTGCTHQAAVEPSPGANEARATVRDASGTSVATASIREQNGLRVRVIAAGLAPGIYGMHIHTVGLCDPPAFASAGPHWNPTGRQHGSLNPLGHHLGDLLNLSVGANGEGTVEFDIPAASLRRAANILLDGDGAALVIHARPDDNRTDPSGNSGDRIACGVLN